MLLKMRFCVLMYRACLPVYVLYRRVNVYKDKIKNAGGLPALPQQQALHDALAGTYAELR
jgi:hypothetical protein